MACFSFCPIGIFDAFGNLTNLFLQIVTSFHGNGHVMVIVSGGPNSILSVGSVAGLYRVALAAVNGQNELSDFANHFVGASCVLSVWFFDHRWHYRLLDCLLENPAFIVTFGRHVGSVFVV